MFQIITNYYYYYKAEGVEEMSEGNFEKSQ